MDVATPGPAASLRIRHEDGAGPRLAAAEQWTKNLVLFAALAFSKHLFETGPLLRACWLRALLRAVRRRATCLNDVADRERDRMHPLKRLRPVASGALPPRTAVGLRPSSGSPAWPCPSCSAFASRLRAACTWP
jgi:hypothetical protein